MRHIRNFFEVAFLDENGNVSKTKATALIAAAAVVVSGTVQPAWLTARIDAIVTIAVLLAGVFLRDAVRKSNKT